MFEEDKNRLHRSLIRVETVCDSGMGAVIPSWNHNRVVWIERNRFDETICPWQDIRAGETYFLAMCNIGETDIRKLRFESWENMGIAGASVL